MTITLNHAFSPELARSNAWTALQDAFDIQAAKTRIPLATRRGEDDFLVWTDTPSGYDLTYFDTVPSRWSMSGVLSGGSQSLPTATFPVHHPALRFYRLSQVSEDLFDAYRNAYLALEYLVSGESPKGRGERELLWLQRVVKSHFAAGVPGGMDIDSTLEKIYVKGRLPLFHAKQGASFLAPQDEERQEIGSLFETLTLRNVSMTLLHPAL